ncbi:hypothetical protein, partial [Tepidiforma sp.]|uniref:hypothetical protein n=1 Tax=Tepidiforma sp. TaxID=2682230 RepID=UPI002ADD7EC0
ALERILAEERPALPAFEPEAWAARPAPAARKERLLADFALQRQASLAILRGLGPGERERTGLLGGEAVAVSGLVARWAEHDRAGLARLERALGETLAEVLERRRRFAEEFARHPPGTD